MDVLRHLLNGGLLEASLRRREIAAELGRWVTRWSRPSSGSPRSSASSDAWRWPKGMPNR